MPNAPLSLPPPPPGLPRRLRGAWGLAAAILAAVVAAVGPCPLRDGSGRPVWRVETVHDGDTVTCLDESGLRQKIRLVGIDAPELDQPHGRVSRDALRGKIGGGVRVESQGRDQHGRLLGRLFVGDRDINLEMVADGHAWAFTGFSRDGPFDAAEASARSAARGLWANPAAISPSRWRQAHPPYDATR
jgi:endonuclease YncB( thermonuclease family)